MDLMNASAIMRHETLERIEERRREAGVPGTDAAEVRRIVEAVSRAGRTGTAGTGIVVVPPVDER